MPPSRPPGAEVGRVTCTEVPPQPGLDNAGAEADMHSFMQVTIPVTVNIPESRKDRVSLSVAVLLCSPRGWPVPVGYAPTPSAEYFDAGRTGTGSATLTFGIAHLQGTLERPLGRQELVADVTGTATRRLDWLVRGGRRQLAGSHEFRFMVDRRACRYTWLEVTAELGDNKRVFSWRKGPESGTRAIVPLIEDDEPQAGVTLMLYEGMQEPGSRLYAGRPLDLPLTVGSDGVTVASGRVATGAIRWSDDISGRPGYLWIQMSAGAVARDGDGTPLAPGASVVLKPGTILRFGSGPRLTVTYDTDSLADWATIPTLPSVLEVDIVIDGEVTGHHITEADYVTIGRSHRDICVDRPDISRSHGVLELRKDGWTYRHESAVKPASLRRRGTVVAQIRQHDAVPIEHGDFIQLTEVVGLALR